MLRKCDPGSEWKNQESPLPATEVVAAIKGITPEQTRAQLCADRLGAHLPSAWPGALERQWSPEKPPGDPSAQRNLVH